MQVGLVPTAMGGTNLYEHWSPGGKLWSNMVTNTHAALQQLGQQGRLRGMVWLQVCAAENTIQMMMCKAEPTLGVGWQCIRGVGL